jgi:hypothetical protein
MSVTYYEEEGFPRELIDDNITGTRGSFNPVRKLKCAWADRIALVNELWYTDYPYVNSNFPAIATKFTCEPFPKSKTSGTNSIAAYDDALVTVFYTTDRFKSGNNYFTEELIPTSGYDARMPTTGLHWTSTSGTSLATGEGPIVSCGSYDYVLTYFQLPDIPLPWALYKDTVNGGPFITKNLGLTFAIDCMRYEGATISHALSHSGVIYFTARLVFSYTWRNGCGWQGVWRPSTSQFEKVYTGSGQALLYPRSVFTF